MHGWTHRSNYASLKIYRMLGSGGVVFVGIVVGGSGDVRAGVVGSGATGLVHSVGFGFGLVLVSVAGSTC